MLAREESSTDRQTPRHPLFPSAKSQRPPTDSLGAPIALLLPTCSPVLSRTISLPPHHPRCGRARVFRGSSPLSGSARLVLRRCRVP